MKSVQYIFTFLFLLSATLISAQTDAEIMLSTDRDSAAMGENIVFVIRLRNAGATALSNIAVNVWISEGLQFVSSTSDKGTSYDKKTGQWNIVIVPKKQTFTTLILKTKVIKDGVNSVYAEVMKMREKDIDSTPGNNSFNEDDIQLKSVTTPMEYCFGEKINITAVGALSFVTYQWYRNSYLVKDSTDRQFTITQPGEYRYTVNGAPLGKCQGQLCVPIIVKYRSTAKITVKNPAAICGTGTIDLTNPSIVSVFPTGGILTYYRSLSEASKSSNPISTTLLKNIKTNATFYVKYTINGACEVLDSVKVRFHPAVKTIAFSSNAINCVNTSAELLSTGSPLGSNYVYNWSGPNFFSSGECNMTTTIPGVYTLSITDINTGCTGTDTAIVRNNVTVVKAYAGRDTTLFIGQSAVLDAKFSGGVAPFTYRWFPPAGLSASNVLRPTAKPETTTTYNLVVTDANGCKGASTVKITISSGSRRESKTFTLICQNDKGLAWIDLKKRLRGEANGGIWTITQGNPGANFDTETGFLNPNGLKVGTYNFKYTISDSPNEIISTEIISIRIQDCNSLEQPNVYHPSTIITNK
ncbi:MAG: hypothetical protein ACOYOA_12555 [Saprospiraceae bacterium]